MGIQGLSFSGGRNGEANGDVRGFTKLLTLPRFQEGEWERSEGRSWSSEPWEGENGGGNGADIEPADGNLSQEGGLGDRGSKRGRESPGSFVLPYLSSETLEESGIGFCCKA